MQRPFWPGHVLYILGWSALALAAPPIVWDPYSPRFLFLLGGIAIWRYSWAVLNWCRFLIYRYRVFPRWRTAADELGEAGLPGHVYLLVTSFRIGAETTRRVYESVFAEAARYGRPATIVASIVERSDEKLIGALFAQLASPRMKLVIVRIPGTGKRDALAFGFRAISKTAPRFDDIVAVIDGDSMLSPGLIARCVPMFRLHPRLGALTTDEMCEVEGNGIFQRWYSLRFAQRHVYMSSVSLSKRVLTLTGRMSMIRADIACDPAFIAQVESDWIDHWRLGRFRFLTGDDKSSWFFILRQGYPMLYVPDVTVTTIETPPDPSFTRSSVMLMRRWFGNMLRTNGRALELGMKPMGFFPWISILDQRISMWTGLVGLVMALLATFLVTPGALFLYFLWIGLTRYLITLSLLASRPRVSATYPFLMYYNQIVGSLVKTTVLFRLDKQKWTRQNTTLLPLRSRLEEWRTIWQSSLMQLVAFTAFVVVLAQATHIITWPDAGFWYVKWKS